MENPCRFITISSNGRVKEECGNVTAYYHSKYIFSKLKRRIENERENNKKIKIEEPVVVDLKVISLGEVE
jgi:hypothetical protein